MIMRFRASISLLAGLLALGLSTQAPAYEVHDGPTGVIKLVPEKTFKGYTLFAPTVKCTTTYLIDMNGDVVHTWKSKYPPGLYATLLPNGNLLRAAAPKDQPVKIGGAGGIIEELDWNGNVVWSYTMLTENEIQHHCFDRMPNGNTMILGWERKTPAEFQAKGRKPGTWPEEVKIKGQAVRDFWVDFVREVDKNGKTVWEWHAWDHIGTGPDQLDINFALPTPVGPGYDSFDWSHFNTVQYLPKTDQILLNSRNFSEFYIVDKKSGKIVKRWGNPAACGKGTRPEWYYDGTQQVFGEHNATMLPNGNVQIFDNGSERPEGNRSRVIEVDPASGKIVWQYAANGSNSFFSYRQGAAERLPNGNVLVTSTHQGHLFEVTPAGEVVWEFVNPIMAGQAKPVFSDREDAVPNAHQTFTNMIHRAYRYAPDYPGLRGKDLSVKAPLLPGYPKFFEVWKPTAVK